MGKRRRLVPLTILLVMVLVASVFTMGCAKSQPKETEKKIKVAAVFPGSIQDLAWNQDGYTVLMKLKDELKLDVSYQENVSQSEVKDVLRNYAREGYDFIIGHDLNFTDPVAEVAPEFPKVMFGISGGYKSGANFASVTGTNWESAYLAGALAGLLTKSNKIGILTSSDSTVAKTMGKAFEQGAQVYNPKAKATRTFTGSWNDSVKGKELTKAMIRDGVDVVFTNAGQSSMGGLEAAKEGGILAIAAPNDLWQVAPDTIVTSAISSSGAMLRNLVEMYVKKTFEGKVYVMGVKSGVEDLTPYHNFDSKLSKDIKDKVAKVRQDLIDGKVTKPTLDK
ncbi:MAG TPA: BMP family protein [Bacillota bacterium]|jgi:basic membrane protein A